MDFLHGWELLSDSACGALPFDDTRRCVAARKGQCKREAPDMARGNLNSPPHPGERAKSGIGFQAGWQMPEEVPSPSA